MMEIENEEKEISSNENVTQTNEEEASPVVVAMTAAEQIHHHQHTNDYDDLTMSLISSNDMDLSLDHHDIKVNKQRRYWLPKEEERFFQIWGRDNWRLTKHGKNTIFFAQWADELKEKYNIDVKLEEIQCKVNQTRAKFRQVKKQLENSKHATVWKKYHIVEKILKNQYRSKDDEPIPPEALENNRDLSPTELLNTGSTSPPPLSTSSHEQTLSLTQIGGGSSSSVNHPSTNDDVNMSNVSLNDSNMTMGNYSNDIFNDDIDIKAEIEEDLRKEEELINEYNQHSNSNYNNYQGVDGYGQQQPQTTELMQQQHQQYQQQYVNQLQDNHHPPPQTQPPLPSASTVASSTVVGAAVAVATAASASEQSQNYNNHLTANADASTNHIIGGGVGGAIPGPVVGASNVGDSTTILTNYNANTNMGMQPPRIINPNAGASALATTPTALIIGGSVGSRKRGNHRYHMSINNSNTLHQQNGIVTSTDNLEALYMEEVRRKNAILSEQSVISRKRLALEQRKINLMEEFFPKYLKLQEHILEKLENKTIVEAAAAVEAASSSAAATTATAITTPEDSIDIQLNE